MSDLDPVTCLFSFPTREVIGPLAPPIIAATSSEWLVGALSSGVGWWNCRDGGGGGGAPFRRDVQLLSLNRSCPCGVYLPWSQNLRLIPNCHCSPRKAFCFVAINTATCVQDGGVELYTSLKLPVFDRKPFLFITKVVVPKLTFYGHLLS